MRQTDSASTALARALIVKRLGIGIYWALICGSASAQVPSEFAIIDAELNTCLVKADGVTPAIDNCNGQAKTAADLILNRVYGGWVEKLKHPAKDEVTDSAEILKRLIASERAWITYRDTGCNLESISMLGGTGETNVYGHCLYAKTKQRVLDLQAIQGSR
jgi:uncharacterized protein YecT (DUF1311 family)